MLAWCKIGEMSRWSYVVWKLAQPRKHFKKMERERKKEGPQRRPNYPLLCPPCHSLLQLKPDDRLVEIFLETDQEFSVK